MSEKTTNIPTSFFGYKRETVDRLLKEKNELLETQKQDIEYLRKELSRFEKTKRDKDSQEPEKQFQNFLKKYRKICDIF